MTKAKFNQLVRVLVDSLGVKCLAPDGADHSSLAALHYAETRQFNRLLTLSLAQFYDRED